MVIYQKCCRVCNASLKDVLKLGNIFPSNFIEKNDEREFERAPLILAECEECGLVQLRHTVDLDSMYRHYYYKSALNSGMVKSLRDVVDNILKYVELKENDIVIDIGCNDGTMLSFFPKEALKIGFDPALNICDSAKEHADIFINDYFDDGRQDNWKAKVITAIAMFYDLPDPLKFTRKVYSYLADDGIFVIQFTDLLSMLKANAFDGICHEHLEYYRLKDVALILEKVGLRIFDVTRNDVNGGSIRIFSCKKDALYPETKNVSDEFQIENDFFRKDDLDSFAKRVQRIKASLLSFFRETKSIQIYGLGASTKGNTLLQYVGLDKRHIVKIGEVNDDKFGKVTIGGEIPIVSEKEMFAENPKILFVLPWHFMSGFLEKHKDFLRVGGVFLAPLPEPALYYYQGDTSQIKTISLYDL